MIGNTKGDGSGSSKFLRLGPNGHIAGEWFPISQDSNVGTANSRIYTVPTNMEWKIQSIYADLTTSSEVGARQVVIEILSPTNIRQIFIPTIAQVNESTIHTFSFFPGAAQWNESTAMPDGSNHTVDTMPELVLSAGYKVKVFDLADIDDEGDNILVRLLALQREIVA